MLLLTLTPSNILTLIRLILGPIAMPILLWYGLPQRCYSINMVLAIVFGMFGLTDFLDGYLARRFTQETELGKFLDPIADKALVFSTVISLMVASKVPVIVGCIIIGRELFVCAMREYAQRYSQTHIPVAWAGKVKTTFQLLYLGMVIINNYNTPPLMLIFMEHFLLAGTIFFTLYSAILYYQSYTKCVVSS